MGYTYLDITDNIVRLVKAGVVVGDNKATVTQYPSGDVVAQYGGATDLWGTTWTPAEVNASNFGVVLSSTVTAGLAKVDSIAVLVVYSLPTSFDRGAMLSVLRVDADRSTAAPHIFSLPRAGLTLGNDPNLALAVDDAEFTTSRYFRPSRNVAKTFTAAEFRLKMTPETNTPGFQLWAKIDDGAAIQLRDDDGMPATLTASGTHRLFFPAGSAGYWVQYLPTVPAASSGQQKVRVELRDFRTMGVINPRVRNRIMASLVLGSGEFKDVTSMRRSVKAQQDALDALKGRVVTYQSPWGAEGWVTVEKVAYREVQNKGAQEWATLADIVLRETLYQ